MRRADRLFQIIQVLRRTRKPLTADAIAAELETSKRTIYRDIATLIEPARADPRRGRHGLHPGKGIRPAAADADAGRDRGRRARRAMGGRPCRSRAGARRPGPDGEDRRYRAGALRPFVLEPASRARPAWNREPDRIDMVRTRAQIHEGKKITLNYRDEQGREQRSARSGRSRSAITRRCGYWRPGASCVRISAASAPTASSRPSISTKNIRNGAICCGRNGGGAWSGRPQRTPDIPVRPLAQPPFRARASVLIESEPML